MRRGYRGRKNDGERCRCFWKAKVKTCGQRRNLKNTKVGIRGVEEHGAIEEELEAVGGEEETAVVEGKRVDPLQFPSVLHDDTGSYKRREHHPLHNSECQNEIFLRMCSPVLGQSPKVEGAVRGHAEPVAGRLVAHELHRLVDGDGGEGGIPQGGGGDGVQAVLDISWVGGGWFVITGERMDYGVNLLGH